MAVLDSGVRAVSRSIATLALLALAACSARAGSGTITPGAAGGPKLLNLRVHFSFDPTARLDDWKKLLSDASTMLYRATNAELRFGRIAMTYPPAASSGADIFVSAGSGTAAAHADGLGEPGEGVDLYAESDIGHPQTVIHELGHYVFGLYDEYNGYRRIGGPGGPWEKRTPGGSELRSYDTSREDDAHGFPLYCTTAADVNPAKACHMQAAYDTGRTNFCLDGMKDADANHNTGKSQGSYWYETQQQYYNKGSCWVRIARKLNCKIPDKIPDVTAAMLPQAGPDFQVGFKSLLALVSDRSLAAGDPMLVASRSSSIAAVHLARSRGTGTNPTSGQYMAVVSFGGGASVDGPLQELTPGVKTAMAGAITGWTAGGAATIGDGLRAALDQILTDPDPGTTATRRILLVSGAPGAGGEDPAGAILSDLRANNVQVYTVGVGGGADRTLLARIARETGGQFTELEDETELPDTLPLLVSMVGDGGLLAPFEGTIAGGATTSRTVHVDPGAQLVSFVLQSSDPADPARLVVVSPSGQIIDAAAPPPGVEALITGVVATINVNSPEDGDWRIDVSGPAGADPQEYLVSVYGQEGGIGVALLVDDEPVAFPWAFRLVASPRTPNGLVAGAQVTARITRPDRTTAVVTLLDDGQEAVSGDRVSGDGQYSAFVREYRGSGTYSFTVNVTNVNGTIATEVGSDAPGRIGRTLAATPVAPFTRTIASSFDVIDAPAGKSVALSPPAGLETIGSGFAIELRWHDGNASTTSYIVERAVSPDDPWEVVGTVAAGTTSLIDRDAGQMFEATYRVTAVSGVGTSDFSGEALARCAVMRAMAVGTPSSSGSSSGCMAVRGPRPETLDVTPLLFIGALLLMAWRRAHDATAGDRSARRTLP